jgi:hypothetical protein
MVTMGAFNKRRFATNCTFHPSNIIDPQPGAEYQEPPFSSQLHTQVFFGLGVDFTLGIQ